MTVEQTSVVDVVSLQGEDQANLWISDHLDWQADEHGHLLTLQEKINAYLRFIEGGELYEVYPQARGRTVSINVVGLHEPSPAARRFLDQVRAIVEGAGFRLTFVREVGGTDELSGKAGPADSADPPGPA